MNKSLLRLLTITATAALLSSGLFAAPDAPAPMYLARVRVEIRPPAGQDAEQFLRTQLPKNDTSITIKRVLDTVFFDIGVTSADSISAAKRANEVAVAIRIALGSDGDIQRLKIWEKAEPPTKPLAPKETKQ